MSCEALSPGCEMLFGKDINQLSPDDRRNLAFDYIDKFYDVDLTEGYLHEMGISRALLPKKLLAEMLENNHSTSMQIASLRMNYCQMILENNPERAPIFDNMRLVSRSVKGNEANLQSKYKENDVYSVNNPFVHISGTLRFSQINEDTPPVIVLNDPTISPGQLSFFLVFDRES